MNLVEMIGMLLPIICNTATVCLAVEKIWLPDLEWGTKSNWLDSVPPDVGSRVVFPKEMRLSVGIAESGLIVSRIDLPREGALVLPDNGQLVFSRSKGPEAKVAKWSREGPLFWADPDNWRSPNSEAVPDVERIPCDSDLVVLPGGQRTLSLRMPFARVEVEAVKLNDETNILPFWEWQKYQGSREFYKGPMSVSYRQLESCQDCVCHPVNGDDILKEVCEITMKRCGDPACEYPIKVEGHCCYYCGARVQFSTKASSVPRMKRIVNEALDNSKDKLSWYVRRTMDGEAEVLIREKGDYYGFGSTEAVNNLAVLLKEDGIEVLGIETAGEALKGSRLGSALGAFFGSLLVVLVLLVIVFPYYGYSLSQISSSWMEGWTSIRGGAPSEAGRSARPFGFARFENAEDANVELAHPAEALGDDDDEDEDVERKPSGGRFANPLYRSKRGRPSSEQKGFDVQESVTLSKLTKKVVQDSLSDEEADLNTYIDN